MYDPRITEEDGDLRQIEETPDERLIEDKTIIEVPVGPPVVLPEQELVAKRYNPTFNTPQDVTGIRYRKLDANGDMQFGHGGGDFWKGQPEAVGQSIKTRLLLFAGEWFLDTTAGTPWGGFPLNDLVVKQGRILAEHTQLSRDAAIRDRILQTDGVRTINTYGSSWRSQSRTFSVNATVDTIYGGRIILTIDTAVRTSNAVQFSVVPTTRRVTPTMNILRPASPIMRSLPRSGRR